MAVVKPELYNNTLTVPQEQETCCTRQGGHTQKPWSIGGRGSKEKMWTRAFTMVSTRRRGKAGFELTSLNHFGRRWATGLFLVGWLSQAHVSRHVFPISQLGDCSACCLQNHPAPRDGQKSHKVTVLFTQPLLNAGSLKIEHQHTYNDILFTLRQCWRNITHTQQSMRGNTPKSQSLSQRVWETTQ